MFILDYCESEVINDASYVLCAFCEMLCCSPVLRGPDFSPHHALWREVKRPEIPTRSFSVSHQISLKEKKKNILQATPQGWRKADSE